MMAASSVPIRPLYIGEPYSVAKPPVSIMSFAPKGISANLPFPVGLSGITWTQA
jgi:hypothetical protein